MLKKNILKDRPKFLYLSASLLLYTSVCFTLLGIELGTLWRLEKHSLIEQYPKFHSSFLGTQIFPSASVTVKGGKCFSLFVNSFISPSVLMCIFIGCRT